MTGITFTHSDNTTPCNTYITQLVEVSSDGGTTWFSSGKAYTDLLASANTDFAFVLAPLTDTFDPTPASPFNYSRKVRVSAKNPYSNQAV